MTDLVNCDLSIAMTAQVDSVLGAHVHKPRLQEDLTFAYWCPSAGRNRFTAVITDLILPTDEDRVLHGNASFSSSYLRRVLEAALQGSGVAFIHGHHGPGWQAMSRDDIVAERDHSTRCYSNRQPRSDLKRLGRCRSREARPNPRRHSWFG